MGLFSKKKRAVIVEESSTEQTESAVCVRIMLLGTWLRKMSVNLTWLLPLIPPDPWHNILVQYEKRCRS